MAPLSGISSKMNIFVWQIILNEPHYMPYQTVNCYLMPLHGISVLKIHLPYVLVYPSENFNPLQTFMT